jgi:hypothetical protein
MHRLAAGLSWLIALTAYTTSARDTTSLTDILRRAGEYVRQFGHDSAVVIGEELYTQEVHRAGRRTAYRELRSEMMFVFVAERQIWFGVRNVLAIKDGRGSWRAIPDAKSRLDGVLRDTTPGEESRLRKLANEGARFNVGSTHRNYNSPTLALDFLDPVVQSRFVFAEAGEETLAGVNALKLQFTEVERPTLISINDSRDVPVSGWLWVLPWDGTVVRTHLDVKQPETARIAGMDASLVVDYQHDSKLGMWVPARMREEYVTRGSSYERIDCVATYSNFRRFETSGRVVSPK